MVSNNYPLYINSSGIHELDEIGWIAAKGETMTLYCVIVPDSVMRELRVRYRHEPPMYGENDIGYLTEYKTYYSQRVGLLRRPYAP